MEMLSVQSILPRLLFPEGGLQRFLEYPSGVVDIRVCRQKSTKWFAKGQLIQGQFQEGFILLLEAYIETKILPANKLDKDTLALWNRPGGPISHSEMFGKMRAYYPDMSAAHNVAVNLLVAPRINGKPTFGPLPPECFKKRSRS